MRKHNLSITLYYRHTSSFHSSQSRASGHIPPPPALFSHSSGFDTFSFSFSPQRFSLLCSCFSISLCFLPCCDTFSCGVNDYLCTCVFFNLFVLTSGEFLILAPYTSSKLVLCPSNARTGDKRLSGDSPRETFDISSRLFLRDRQSHPRSFVSNLSDGIFCFCFSLCCLSKFVR